MRNHIEKTNAVYKARANMDRKKVEFVRGDLVWLHLIKERLPSRRKNELIVNGDGPFKVIKMAGDNAYKL